MLGSSSTEQLHGQLLPQIQNTDTEKAILEPSAGNLACKGKCLYILTDMKISRGLGPLASLWHGKISDETRHTKYYFHFIMQ